MRSREKLISLGYTNCGTSTPNSAKLTKVNSNQKGTKFKRKERKGKEKRDHVKDQLDREQILFLTF